MSVVLPCLSGVGGPTNGCSECPNLRLDVLREKIGVQDPDRPQRPAESTALQGQREAGRVEVYVGTSARSSSSRIRYDAENRHAVTSAWRLGIVLNGDDPQ